ncbi:transferase family-domain-containing protein [Podospora fimiseda]|uniref:Transferase family-domain-containing protein n=1 Tax=Podospora fimiseda TaxID=252190 RepID=A0AAN6YTS3_9PEZI|nr:transferase family-domain-containing protein [Podospora fimiseda]
MTAVVISGLEKVFPTKPITTPQIVPLSLLDATTAEFAFTSAVWLFNPPSTPIPDVASHLKQSLAGTLLYYPQWCGTCKPSSSTAIASHHTDRLGRIHVHFGLPSDPGVELVTGSTSSSLDDLYPSKRITTNPIWTNPDLSAFLPPTKIGSTLALNDTQEPLLAIQLTTTSCNGFVLGIKAAHPMADITSLIHFVKTWAAIANSPSKELSSLPVSDPSNLDAFAAGDINAPNPHPTVIEKVKALPMHRYDWWHPHSIKNCPWPTSGPPDGFQIEEEIETGNKPMPWHEWDVSAPVERRVIHFTAEQIEILFERANRNPERKLSKHDAIVSHIWSCITRARKPNPQQDDTEPIHCDLVIGVRRALGLGEAFQGSPIVIVNVEMPVSEVSIPDNTAKIAEKIRETIEKVNNKEALAAHLHGLAFEKSPQRIWQAFLGRRHILVTSWVRAGLYEIDFGFGGGVRYSEGIVPAMDGNVVVKEGPPLELGGNGKEGWSRNGVDVLVCLRDEDMQRFVEDEFLMPEKFYVKECYRIGLKMAGIIWV